jgi:hypothetical protein
VASHMSHEGEDRPDRIAGWEDWGWLQGEGEGRHRRSRSFCSLMNSIFTFSSFFRRFSFSKTYREGKA